MPLCICQFLGPLSFFSSSLDQLFSVHSCHSISLAAAVVFRQPYCIVFVPHCPHSFITSATAFTACAICAHPLSPSFPFPFLSPLSPSPSHVSPPFWECNMALDLLVARPSPLLTHTGPLRTLYYSPCTTFEYIYVCISIFLCNNSLSLHIGNSPYSAFVMYPT